MSPSAVLFLVSSFAAYAAERMFGGNDAVRWPVQALSVLLLLAALGARARSLGRHPSATRLALLFYGIAASSVVFYLLQQRDSIAALGLVGDSATHFRTAMQCAIPLVWIIGTLPAIAIDRTLSSSPHSVHPLRLRTALMGGLAVAFGLAMLFPINYIAMSKNERFDYGFFKTTSVGTATRNAVEGLTDTMRIVLFFDPTSEVLREVEPYFDDLKGPNVSVEVMDQAMSPEQAKAWKVKDNGNVVFVRGEGDEERTEVLKIGTDLNAARKDLRKLDSKVQTSLLKLANEKRTAYFTVGHNEYYWKNTKDESENIDTMKKGIESLNFKVKELGIDDGLANAVPDDAAIVLIVGPRRPFLPEEIRALQEYRDRGGALYVMLENGDYPDPALAALVGVTYEAGPVLSDKGFARVTSGPSDKAYIVTNKFSSHESVTTLSKNSNSATLVLPFSGAIKELPEHAGKYTATVKGMPDWWVDTNGNFEFDKDVEKRGGLESAAILTGPATGADAKEWRAAVVGDATWASNLVIRQSQANVVYLVDTLAWLTKSPELGGETESEEDVKIQHTKESEAIWFYGTSALVPALVFFLGWLRVSSRTRRGAA